MKNKNVVKGISPEQLQGMFLDIAQKVGDEILQSFRETNSASCVERP